jgi:hypothetical protein
VNLLATQAIPAANFDEETLFHMSLTYVSPFGGADG